METVRGDAQCIGGRDFPGAEDLSLPLLFLLGGWSRSSCSLEAMVHHLVSIAEFFVIPENESDKVAFESNVTDHQGGRLSLLKSQETAWSSV